MRPRPVRSLAADCEIIKKNQAHNKFVGSRLFCWIISIWFRFLSDTGWLVPRNAGADRPQFNGQSLFSLSNHKHFLWPAVYQLRRDINVNENERWSQDIFTRPKKCVNDWTNTDGRWSIFEPGCWHWMLLLLSDDVISIIWKQSEDIDTQKTRRTRSSRPRGWRNIKKAGISKRPLQDQPRRRRQWVAARLISI